MTDATRSSLHHETGAGGDAAPGDEHEGGAGAGVRSYLIGLGAAAMLTGMSFWVLHTDLIWGPGIPMALATLAVAQMGVHLVFFLHITSGPDNINNILALAFGLLIVMLLVGGSLWIMTHLNQNMMAPPVEVGVLHHAGCNAAPERCTRT